MIGSPDTRMTSEDATNLYEYLEARGIRIWIDGGWAVDALLGKQTRPHVDLDIAIEQAEVTRLRSLLASDGYTEIPRADSSSWNFVLRDSAGRRIDVHAIIFDSAGNGVLGPPENGNMYPKGSLDGSGVIAGRKVRCIAPEFLIRFHTGYPPRETDRHDVCLLCERFGVPPPVGYG